MYETFERLPNARKHQILRVCLEEFIENGYKNASTNTIVKRLEISKGVLFLYFKSKKNLYLYLVEHITEILIDDYLNFQGGSIEDIDIFDNLGEYYKELIQKKPEAFLLMLQAFINTPEEIKEEIDARHNKAHDRIYRHMNVNGFRQEVDIRMVDDLLHMVSYYIGQMIYNDLRGKCMAAAMMDEVNRNMDKYVEQFSKYVDILKYGVYAR